MGVNASERGQGDSRPVGRLPSKVLHFGAAAIGVESTDRASLAWLEEFLVPPFRVGGGAGGFLVRLAVDPARHQALEEVRAQTSRSLLPFFRLDREVLSMEAFRAGDLSVAHDAKFDCFYVLDRERVEVVGHPRATSYRSGLMRVVREVASVAALAAGVRLLHAGALEIEGEAIVIAGPKASGKSTLLCYLARVAGARLLANDRVVVSEERDSFAAQGMPTVVSIRPRTLEGFPELAHDIPAMRRPALLMLEELREALRTHPPFDPRQRLRLSPAQLARQLGVGRAAGARLRAIVFPEPRAGGQTLEVARLSLEEARLRLREARLAVGTDKSPTVFERMRAAPRPQDTDVDAIAARVPCFRARAGLDAYRGEEARARLLAALLDARPRPPAT